MTLKKNIYTKLSGIKRRRDSFFDYLFPISKTVLLKGQDHLLAIEKNFFQETYKRFYFADILAVTIQKTETGKNQSILLGIGGLLSVFFTYYVNSGSSDFLFYSGIAFTVVSICFFFITIVKGPTCRYFLQTPVQCEELSSVKRLGAAHTITSIIKESILPVQGKMDPEEVREKAALITSEEINYQGVYSREKIRTVLSCDTRFHSILYWFLIVLSVIGLLDISLNSVVITLLILIFHFTSIIFSIIALVRQYETDMTKEVKKLVWFCLTFLCFFCIVGIAQYMYLGVTNSHVRELMIMPGKNNEWEMVKVISRIPSSESLYLLVPDFLFVFFSSTSGIVGLFQLKRYFKSKEKH